MKQIQILAVSFFIVLSISCSKSADDNGDSKPPLPDPTPSPNVVEIIQDNTFKRGFALTPIDPKTVQQGGGFEKTYLDTIDFNRDGSQPIWHIAQWHSKYNFAHAKPIVADDGAVWYANDGNSKKIALYPDNSLWLEVNASLEYDAPRENGEHWPHLLIAHDFNDKSPNVGKAKRLMYSMELKLEKEENKMATGTFNKSRHTAQSPFFFVLKNLNKNSPDFNQRIWFGIPSYDYRYTEMNNQEKIMWDIGTNQYIYTVPQKPIWGIISFQDKNWHKGEADIKPLILRALEAMKEKDVFKNTTPDDLVITGMNFGWEVPGTFDVAIRVKDISLKMIH